MLDPKLMADIFPDVCKPVSDGANKDVYIPAPHNKPTDRAAPIEKKSCGDKTGKASHSQNLFSLQAAKKDLPPCGIGEFIAILSSSFGAALHEEEYAPYPQVWFTDEEAAEKCIGRGYQMTAEQARKYLGKILERGHRLILYRENVTIGRREYRRGNLQHRSAKEYFGVEAPSLKCEWPPAQEYRTRYNRAV